MPSTSRPPLISSTVAARFARTAGGENPAQGLIERPCFPRSVPYRGHDGCAMQQAEILGVVGAVVGDHDDPLWRPRLPAQGRDGGINCRGLVVGGDEDNDPAVAVAAHRQMIMLRPPRPWPGCAVQQNRHRGPPVCDAYRAIWGG